LFAILLPVSGLALSNRYELALIVFGEQGSIPAEMDVALHGLAFPLFSLHILLHILAALYYQFIRRDNLLARM
jgi:cytochrome b561